MNLRKISSRKRIRLQRTAEFEIEPNERRLIPYLARAVVAGTSYYKEPSACPPVSGKIDVGIRQAVKLLREHNIETCESCEGGPGHAYPEPTVAFYGTPEAGWRAVSICLAHGLPVLSLKRTWDFVEPNEPTGPHWEITFFKRMI